ncbi:MAG TPA: hypothetical protein VNA25_03210 [Phycisphaerae bacterium]|nr:hypothetical protein [Phycisphaerae bacterium]
MARKRKRIAHKPPLEHGSPDTASSSVQGGTPPPAAEGQVETPQAHRAPEPKPITDRDLGTSIFTAFGPEGTDDQKAEAKANVRRYLAQLIQKHPVGMKYNIVFLYDELQMVQSDADNIYSAVTKFEESKPLLLILHSPGGYIGPAYLIGKLLREYSDGNLDIVVPRRAKSGATLICCAADHIHMGSLSELGPIDPQIEGMPALGLKSSIQHIAELVRENPHATELFAKYMSQSIRPIDLGYYERVAESAVQYAERLLRPHASELEQAPEKIAQALVYSYKDHGFVIDRQEAQGIFGGKVVKYNTEEYNLGNAVYQGLVFVTWVAGLVDQRFYMIGCLTSDPGFLKKTK